MGRQFFLPFLQGLRGRGVFLKIYPKRGLSKSNPHVFAVCKRDICYLADPVFCWQGLHTSFFLGR